MPPPGGSTLVLLKLAAAAFTLAVATIGVSLPWILRQKISRVARALSLGNMLSAGVMVGGGLLHLLPEAVENFDEQTDARFPFVYLAFALGVLLPLFVESLLDGSGHGHVHSSTQHLLVGERIRSETADLAETERRQAWPASETELHAHPARDRNGSCETIAPDSATSEVTSDLVELDEVAHLSQLPVMSAVVLQMALSFHSLLEGLGQGAAPNAQSVAEVLLLITMHKGLIAFALGSALLHALLPARLTLVLCAVFVLATPLGVCVGIALSGGDDGGELGAWSHLLLAMAGGTFLYVALCEVVPRELSGGRAPRLMQLTLMMLGFVAMAVLAVWL